MKIRENNIELLAEEIKENYDKFCENRKCYECKYQYTGCCETLYALEYLTNNGVLKLDRK